MSEENLFEIDSVDQEASVADGMAGETEIVDFDQNGLLLKIATCLLYTSPSPRDR